MPVEKPTNGLILVYQLNFKQNIWHMRFAEETGRIAIECRDADALQVSYSVVEASSGALILDNYQPTKSWWTGLADIQDKVLFLHQMGAGGMGQAKEIIAVALADGKIMWQLPGYSLYGLSENYLYARPEATETGTLVGVNIDAGTFTGESLTLYEVASDLAEFQARGARVVQVPAHYPAQNSYFADLSRFLVLKTQYKVVSAIDYLETEDWLIFGFYPELGNSEKTYRVAVFNQQGDLLGQVELGNNLTGLGTDNFFWFEKKLFLLKNKKSLLAYRF